MTVPETPSARLPASGSFSSQDPSARECERNASSSVGTPFFTETYDLQQSILYLLRRAIMGLNQVVSDQTDLGGPSFPQWVPLHKVHLGHANTVAELARQCSLDTGAMTRLLDRLEAKGLCRRVRSDKDRRVVHIELTDQGLEAAQQVPKVLSRVYNQALDGFSHAEWEQLQELLWRLIGNAERISQQTASGVGGKSAEEGAE